mgnify:CR=1 FL=1
MVRHSRATRALAVASHEGGRVDHDDNFSEPRRRHHAASALSCAGFPPPIITGLRASWFHACAGWLAGPPSLGSMSDQVDRRCALA